LSRLQWLAVAAIILASVGSVLGAREPMPESAEPDS
jgi:threonine/homoserine efflux transporter RhtA